MSALICIACLVVGLILGFTAVAICLGTSGADCHINRGERAE